MVPEISCDLRHALTFDETVQKDSQESVRCERAPMNEAPSPTIVKTWCSA